MVSFGEARLSLLAEELVRFAGHYDALLFDCASGINSTVTAFLGAVPQGIVVVQPDPTSLMDAYALIKVIHQEGIAARVNLVMNGIRNRAGGERILTQLQAVVRDYLQVDLECLGMIPHTPRVAGALQARQPLVAFDQSDAAAKEVANIARRIVQRQQATTTPNRLNAAQLLQGMLTKKPKS
jgi:flagellar biosynthesis protein FlhG